MKFRGNKIPKLTWAPPKLSTILNTNMNSILNNTSLLIQFFDKTLVFNHACGLYVSRITLNIINYIVIKQIINNLNISNNLEQMIAFSKPS